MPKSRRVDPAAGPSSSTGKWTNPRSFELIIDWAKAQQFLTDPSRPWLRVPNGENIGPAPDILPEPYGDLIRLVENILMELLRKTPSTLDVCIWLTGKIACVDGGIDADLEDLIQPAITRLVEQALALSAMNAVIDELGSGFYIAARSFFPDSNDTDKIDPQLREKLPPPAELEEAIAALRTATERADHPISSEQVPDELEAIRAAIRKVKAPIRKWLQAALNAAAGKDYGEEKETVVAKTNQVAKELGVRFKLSNDDNLVRLRYVKPARSQGLVQARTSDRALTPLHSAPEIPNITVTEQND